MKTKQTIAFDLGNTLVKMRPATLLVDYKKLLSLKKFFSLVVITGAKRTETVNILNKLKVYDLFDFLLTKDDTEFRKPSKKLISLVEKSLRTEIVLYVGDSKNDAKMALDAKKLFLSSNLFQ